MLDAKRKMIIVMILFVFAIGLYIALPMISLADGNPENINCPCYQFETGDRVYYRCVNVVGGTTYYWILDTVYSNPLALYRYGNELRVQTSSQGVYHFTSAYYIDPQNRTWQFNTNGIYITDSNYMCPAIFGSIPNVIRTTEFKTNIPIFETQSEAQAYLQGTVPLSNAINYGKSWNVEHGQFERDTDAYYYLSSYDGFTSGHAEIDPITYEDNWEPLDLLDADDEPNILYRAMKNVGITAQNILTFLQYYIDKIIVLLVNFYQIYKDFISGFASTILENLKDFFDWIWERDTILGISMADMYNFFSTLFTNIGDDIESILTNIQDIADAVVSDTTEVIEDGIEVILPDKLRYIYENIYTMGTNGGMESEFSINTLLSYLFVPSDNYFDSKVEIIREKFEFVNSINAVVDAIKVSILSISHVSPSFTIPSFSLYGQTIQGYTISFDWFGQFKPYTDPIILAFAYITFFFNLYCNLPNIIHGIPSSSGIRSIPSLNDDSAFTYYESMASEYDRNNKANLDWLERL